MILLESVLFYRKTNGMFITKVSTRWDTVLPRASAVILSLWNLVYCLKMLSYRSDLSCHFLFPSSQSSQKISAYTQIQFSLHTYMSGWSVYVYMYVYTHTHGCGMGIHQVVGLGSYLIHHGKVAGLWRVLGVDGWVTFTNPW